MSKLLLLIVTLITVINVNTTFAKEKDNFIFDESTGKIIEYVGKGGNVVIPSKINGIDVKSIGEYAFYYSYGSLPRSNLTSIIIPDGITTIENYSFSECTSLTDIIIPKSVTKIGDFAFYRCTSLINLKLPNNLKEIGHEAFASCYNLTNVIIPSSLEYIGDAIFQDCRNLKNVVLQDGLTSIGNYQFAYCGKLEKITLPESLISIGKEAFSNCKKLTTIKIPKSVTNIGDLAFERSEKLKMIYVKDSNTKYSSLNGVLFNKDKTQLIQYPIGIESNSYTIPNSVLILKKSSFAYSNLENIIISDNVKSIGDFAFWGCNNLKNIIVPNNVIEIGESAFYELSAVKVEGENDSYAKEYSKKNNISFSTIQLASNKHKENENTNDWLFAKIIEKNLIKYFSYKEKDDKVVFNWFN